MLSKQEFMYVIIGAVAMIFLSFLPFSPVMGGALTGYLDNNDTWRGFIMGIYAGIVGAFLVLVIILGLVSIIGFGVFAMNDPLSIDILAVSRVVTTVIVVAFIGIAGSMILLSGVGGAIGSYLRQETS